MLELIKIRKDIEFILNQLKCLVKKNCSCAEENGALMPGDNVSALVNDAGYVTGETANQDLQSVLTEDNKSTLPARFINGDEDKNTVINFQGIFFEEGAEENRFITTFTIEEGLSEDREWLIPLQEDGTTVYVASRQWTEKVFSLKPIPLTYITLVDKITNSTLVPGQVYLLTDYESTWYDEDNGFTKSSGVTEPLYLIATDVNKLHNECRSKLYPEDIVYYSLLDNTEGFTKGKIYRRIDTIKNNDVGTDWRHITYRRYKINVTNTHTVGNDYYVGDVVKQDGNTTVWVCVEDDLESTGTSLSKWAQFPYDHGQYRGTNQTSLRVYCVPNIWADIPVDPLDYLDYTLFNMTEYEDNQVYNNTISFQTLSNSVFFGFVKGNIISKIIRANNCLHLVNNKIEINFIGNNLISLYSNSMDLCSQNTSSGFTGNTIRAEFSENKITTKFSQNTINGTRVAQSIFEKDIYSNVVLNANIFNSSFGYAFFGNKLLNGTIAFSNIASQFFNNIVRVPINSSIVGDYFRDMEITTSTTNLTNWTIEGNIQGPLNLPFINGDEYSPYFYKSKDDYSIEYKDEFGDVIIEKVT